MRCIINPSLDISYGPCWLLFRLDSVFMSLSWPWHFVSVSAAEKQQRRELLDFRGYVAQCSVLVVVLAIRVYQNYAQDADAVRQRSRHRQQSWWDLPPLQGWTETRRQYLISLVWLGWLLSLSAWKTGDGRCNCQLQYMMAYSC